MLIILKLLAAWAIVGLLRHLIIGIMAVITTARFIKENGITAGPVPRKALAQHAKRHWPIVQAVVNGIRLPLFAIVSAVLIFAF